MAKLSKAAQAERAEAIDKLREWIKPGDTVHTVLDRVSASGMSRVIRVVLLKCGKDGVPMDLHPNYLVGKALGLRHGKRHGREMDGLVMGGCGMDMGFALVYDLSHTLYPAGFGCIGKGCPSNDHSNGDRDYTPHDDGTPRPEGCTCLTSLPGAPQPPCPVCKEAGYYSAPTPTGAPHRHYHSSGGYALRHRWL
jgi:hypothetical protein